MCNYCKGIPKSSLERTQVGKTKNGKPRYEFVTVVKLIPFDFGPTCEATISGDTLNIEYSGYSCDSSFRDKIKINYCPFCGEKLTNT